MIEKNIIIRGESKLLETELGKHAEHPGKTSVLYSSIFRLFGLPFVLGRTKSGTVKAPRSMGKTTGDVKSRQGRKSESKERADRDFSEDAGLRLAASPCRWERVEEEAKKAR